jgi:hypothetical protein
MFKTKKCKIFKKMKKSIKESIILSLLFLLISINAISQDKEWINLFDGETLEGWSIHSGKAKYKVEDGAIVGTAVKDSPNSFLCTDQEYGDFILEFEVFLTDPKLNSGVQFRSIIAGEELVFWFRNSDGIPQPKRIPADRVYGYQVEIASETVGSSGGVYDEARRAFMPWKPEEGSEASKAFKNDQWNKYRIECRGISIKTMVNGIVCADFKDALNDNGIIGLQVHGVGSDPTPYEVRWRNIRIIPLD